VSIAAGLQADSRTGSPAHLTLAQPENFPAAVEIVLVCSLRAIRLVHRFRLHRSAAMDYRNCLCQALMVPCFLGTDLHRRTVHWREGRTDVAFGRDEKDVGVRSLSCGVAGLQVEQHSVA
jgi:hypothetical protein